MRSQILQATILSCVILGNASVGSNFPGTAVDTTLKATSSAVNGTAVMAKSSKGSGVSAEGRTFGITGMGDSAGVSGVSGKGEGVLGNSTSGPGVRGVSSAFYGVYGVSPYTGVFGYAYSNGPGVTGMGTVGVYGTGSGSAASNGIGMYAVGSGGSTAYGIIATAKKGEKENWAGWFDGNVAITGECSPCVISDGRTKKNIKPLKGSLKKVMAMGARSYEMKTGEYASSMNLAEGAQNGLIAQELELVVPEAVHEVIAPPYYTEEERKQGVKKEGVALKSVNYTALIPLLIAAIQEQQAEIEALKAGR